GVVIGSHLDSVPDGGAYDGPLGVVSAFAVVDALREHGLQPSVPLAVVNFVDEEGARFGVACAGSRVLTGAVSAERALGLTDADGRTMAQALTAAGRDVGDFGADPDALRRAGCFVELHVEQGRGLVDLDFAVGLASDIWPHGRWRIDLPGEANHAGTTAMDDRHDAMISMAQVTLKARDLAIEHGCVATVGKAAIEPGGVNAIASHVRAWLDARGSQPEAVAEVVAGMRRTVVGLGGQMSEESWTPATPFDPALTQRLGEVLARPVRGIRAGERPHLATPTPLSVPVMGTGAGHDAGILANAGIPASMLLVRNPTGLSHSPAEFAEQQDCHVGVEALAACIIDLTDAAWTVSR
ncbi:MAG: allantoate amidohydrolase, partial [Ornithinimicrobium sp.]